MSNPLWKILETQSLHPGIRLDRCELPNGQMIYAHVLEYADEIMVLALTKKQEVVLTKQYRHGVQDTIMELPGGSVDQDESPLEAAKRELLEETGYASDTFIEVGHGSPNPANYASRIYYFLALDVEPIGARSDYDSGVSEVVLIHFNEVIHLAKMGGLAHSLNLSTLFYVLGYLNRIS